MPKEKIRLAAVGDLHVRTSQKGEWSSFFADISERADVLLICGDLTDTGDEAEAMLLAGELKNCKIPVVAVLGNHDFEKGRQKLIRQALQSDQVHVLDGEAVVIHGVGFAGVKGFGSGFNHHMLTLFGEEGMKAFVREAVDEAMRLDRALARLEANPEVAVKIAVLHYAPIAGTVVGEPEPLFPFLGCSYLAEPLSRRNVQAAFHGHAHAGTLSGETQDGVKVFNVSKPILEREGFEPPFYLYEF